MEHQVLRVDTRAQSAPHLDPPHLERREAQRLGREHVAHLRRADAEGHSPEGAVGRGVRVAARDHHARLREAQLRARSRARCPGGPKPRRRAGSRTRGRPARARRSSPRRAGPGTDARSCSSARCGRRSRRSGPDARPSSPGRAASRTPAGSSPRGSGGARRRPAPGRSATSAPRAGPTPSGRDSCPPPHPPWSARRAAAPASDPWPAVSPGHSIKSSECFLRVQVDLLNIAAWIPR